MTHKHLSFLLAVLMSMVTNVASAYDACIDGIYYNLGMTATVTYRSFSNGTVTSDYSGDVVIPASVTYYDYEYPVTSIDNYAFYNCSDLTSLAIPKSVTSISSSAFSNCSALTSIVVDEGNRKYDSRNDCNAIIESSSNTLILGCQNTVIPESITSIGMHAFKGCSGLLSVTIPNSVTSIAGSAFSDCSGLTSLTIPESVTSISASAFSGCSGITAISVENGNSKYDSRNDCNAIIESSSNTLIRGCQNTIIPEGVIEIGISAFSYCSGLTSLTIPNSVVSIDNYAFQRCSGLTSVTFSNSVTSIGESAFSGCTGLTSLIIPESVTSIRTGAFSGCIGLTSIVVNSGNSVYDSRNDCNAIIESYSNALIKGCKNTIIPEGVIGIATGAFSGCYGLTSLSIPNSVTIIGAGAFSGCSDLASVTIPHSVDSIYNRAFYGCNGLTSVYMMKEEPLIIEENVFSNRGNATLYVPGGSISAYRSADYWKDFKHIIELVPTTITAENKTVVYGDELPTLTYSLNGGTVWETLELTTTATSTSPVGTYPIVISQGSVTDLDVTYVNGTLTIIPAPLTIMAKSYLRNEGQENPTFEVSYSGFKNGENASVLTTQPKISCSASSDSPAGTYEIIPSGAEAQNYDINYVNGTLTIVAPASVSVANKTMVYGDPVPELTYEASGGDLNGIPQLSTTATSTSPVGSYPITITQGSVNNPNVTYTNGILTITKAPLTVSAKSYKRNRGQDNPTFEVIYNGFKNGEDESVLEKEPTITCNATANSPLGEYNIVPSGAQAQNYSISYVNGTLSIVDYILFADDIVQSLCLANWDRNNDGYLSKEEAAAVTDIGSVFRNSSITSFDELKYFTGLSSIPANAFNGCLNLLSIVIPESVTSIGDYAFDKTQLKSLTIGSGVTTISTSVINNGSKPTKTIWLTNTPPSNYSYAKGTINYVSNNQYESLSNVTEYPFLSSMFEVDGVKYVPVSPSERTCDVIDCRYDASIENVKVDSSVVYQGITMAVKNVNSYAFYNNSYIKNVHLNNKGYIGENAFRGIGALSAYVNNAGEIKTSAFYSCKNLYILSLGQDVTSIDRAVFYSCSMLENAIIPDGVTAIGSSAFNGCTKLKSVQIGTGIREINNNTFEDCSSLVEVQIGRNVNSIGNYAFSGCLTLSTITIPTSVSTINNYVFQGCSSLSNVIMEDAANSELSLGSNGEAPLFADCLLDSVYIGRDITFTTSRECGYSPFHNNASLRTVVISVHENEINDKEFEGCSQLQNVEINNGIRSIGQYAFSGCSMLEEIVIPNGVTSIGSYAFQHCSKMTMAKMGTGVTAIDSYTFYGCSSLTNMQIGENVISIGTKAFSGCSALPMVTIPKSVNLINNYVFQNCLALATVIMEDKENTELSLGSNGSSPLFSDCPLDSVYIGRNISYQTNSSSGYSPFYRNTTLRSVTITDRETEISDNEFYGCTNLKNVRIGDGVTTIGKWAFSGCSSLDYFAFGSSVTSIGQEAFSDCTTVTNIISRAETPPICGTQALDDINKWTCHLRVLPGMSSVYQAAPQWKEFFFIEETALDDQPVSSITLSEHDIIIEEIGGTIQLTAMVLPTTVMNKHVLWSSDNEQVATVENGLVTAIGYGTAHITATSEEDADKKDICLVTVRVSLAQALAELHAAIAEAQELYDNSTEGVQPGQYEEGARAELLEVIVQASTVANAGTDYDAIVQSVDDINEAIDIFESKMVTIAPSNALSIEPVTISSGKNTMLSISLTNEDEIIMTDFYLQLPEGLSIAKDEGDYYDVTINDERSNRHVLEVDMNSEGLYHFLCYSSKNNALKGNDGVLFSVNLQCNENVETGIYHGMIKTIVMADIDRNEITQPNYTFIINVQDIEPGDVNGDGRINGLDIVEMVDHIMERPSENFNFDAAELTGDSTVNGMDLVELVSLIMSQSSGTQNAPALIRGINGERQEGLTLTAENSGAITLGVEATDNFILAQCIVEMSEGMTLQDISTDGSHTVEWQELEDGRYMVLLYSTRNAILPSNKSLLTLSCTGEGNIWVTDALLVNENRQGCWFANVALDNATGINEMERMESGENEKLYDLAGRRVSSSLRHSSASSLPKGVYIVNGKKVLVK